MCFRSSFRSTHRKTLLIEKLKRGDQDFLFKKRRIKNVAADQTHYKCNTELSEQGTQTEDRDVAFLSTIL